MQNENNVGLLFIEPAPSLIGQGHRTETEAAIKLQRFAVISKGKILPWITHDALCQKGLL